MHSFKNIQVLKNITDRSNKIKEDKGKTDKKIQCVILDEKHSKREILGEIGKISVNLYFGL